MSTISPNMSLPIPGVGTTSGPQYATDVNNCLTLVDQHNHTPGSGVAITPDALDITSDLGFNGFALTAVGGVQLTATTSPGIGSIYESGVDLYYTDGDGNDIRITQSGGIAGSPGSISGLTSPASATYVAGSSTFVWQSNTNIAANMDAGSLLLRNLSPNSTYAITLAPPSALGSNYTITLPALPASNKVLSINASGTLSTGGAGTVDTTDLAANSVTTVKIVDLNVTTAKINDLAITTGKIAAGALSADATGRAKMADGFLSDDSTGRAKMQDNFILTSKISDNQVTLPKLAAATATVTTTSGAFSTTTSGGYVTIPTLVGTITVPAGAAGRYVTVNVIPDGSTSNAQFSSSAGTGSVAIFRDSTQIATLAIPAGSFPGIFSTLDLPGAGTVEYSVRVKASGGSSTCAVSFVKLAIVIL